MSMDKLLVEVRECVEREYGRAGAKFGLTNHSDHESYAIILEELQEAEQEISNFKRGLNDFWECVRGNYSDYDKYTECVRMYNTALLGACEMIQVAAMAKKAAITVCDTCAVSEIGGREANSE